MMLFAIVTGVLMLVITTIVYMILDNAAQQVDNILYQTIGKIHKDGVDGCQRNSNPLERERCLTTVNNAYMSALLSMALLAGLPGGFIIALLLHLSNILGD